MALPRALVSLRHRDARRFFLGLAVSNIGTWMQFTAMAIVLYRLTGRAADVGLALFAQFLPMLLLGAWAGALADRVDKRRMAIVTQSGLALHATVLAVVEWVWGLDLVTVMALSVVQGVFGALDNPARRGYVVELVDPSEITNATSLNTAVMTGSRAIGPALGAWLEAPLGAAMLFALNALSFAAVLLAMLGARASGRRPAPRSPRGGKPVREAIAWVWRAPRMRLYYLVFTAVGTFAFNYSVSLLKLADRRFGDERLLGSLLAVTSVGSVIGSLVVGSQRHIGTRWFAGSAAVLGLSGPLVAWSPSVWLAYLALLPLGAGGAGFVASLNAITQQECPADMRGRLLALGAVAFLGSTPIGAPITGAIADTIGAEWGLAYGSVVTLVCVAVTIVLIRNWSGSKVPAAQDESPALAS